MRSIITLTLIVALLAFAAACSSGAAPTATQPAPTPSPTTPPATPTQASTTLIEWSDEDCIFRPHGELGELTRVTRTYVENEPKRNVERLFLKFHQSEAESTILRCDMNTAGLFSTWWVQSFPAEQDAQRLFESLILVTRPGVDRLNQNPRSCALIRAGKDGQDSYNLDFVDKGICESSVFNGLSGIVVYGDTVIGIDSQFYEEFFEPLLAHAKALVDKRTSS